MSQFKDYATSAFFNVKLTKPQLLYLINYPNGASYVQNQFMTEAALRNKGLLHINRVDGFSTDYPYRKDIVGPIVHIRQVLTKEAELLIPLLELTFPELKIDSVEKATKVFK